MYIFAAQNLWQFLVTIPGEVLKPENEDRIFASFNLDVAVEKNAIINLVNKMLLP